MALLMVGMIFNGCKRVEVVAPEQSTMLPLALGNEWVYVDSFITTTTLPTSDTVVLEAVYNVTRKKALEHYTADKSMLRYDAWEIRYNYGRFLPTTVLVKDDSLFSSFYTPYTFGSGGQNCNDVQQTIVERPSFFYTYQGGLAATMVKPSGDGVLMPFAPIFQDLPTCFALGPLNYNTATYTVFYQPLASSTALVNLTTPAGTFACYDLGDVLWAEGVGMVQSYHEGETSFYDTNLQLQTGQLKWKRSLKSYHLE